jgi:serine/threonine protein phosphatase PrpC
MIEQATAKGSRHSQEDRHIVVHYPEGTLLAVMDGHGGDTVSGFLAESLPSVWSQHLATDLNIRQVCVLVFRALHVQTQFYHAGSTLSLAFISTDKKFAYIAVLGDSPVIADRKNGSVFIGPDHNARSNHEERSKAIARGGVYSDGYMFASFNGDGLQMTRALGDCSLNSILDRTPEVFQIELGDFLLIGSDGLLDPTHYGNSAAKRVIARIVAGATAAQLVDRAVNIPTEDNVTAVLWRREKPDVQKD